MAHKYQTFADLLYASYSGLQTFGFAFARGKQRLEDRERKRMKKTGNNDVAPTLTAKPKTVVLAKKRKTAISVDAQEGGGSKRMPIPKGMNEDFEALVGRIQATSDALQQDALVVINRSVTTRAWLTGYYIVEYEQHGADRAKYGEGLLKKLSARLGTDKYAVPTLKTYRLFYKLYPELSVEVYRYLESRFGEGSTVSSQLTMFADAIEAETWYDSLMAA